MEGKTALLTGTTTTNLSEKANRFRGAGSVAALLLEADMRASFAWTLLVCSCCFPRLSLSERDAIDLNWWDSRAEGWQACLQLRAQRCKFILMSLLPVTGFQLQEWCRAVHFVRDIPRRPQDFKRVHTQGGTDDCASP